ncbi:MAG: tetratricopeptide repeat protein, partial [Acidobacteria bacterium]|nr:tetratricopeptide repeat protein [Acidobacteriota bacterium]
MLAVVRILCFSLLCAVSVAAQTPAPNADKLLAQALLQHQAGEFEAAGKTYQAFLALRPERYDIRSNFGAVLARQGRYQEAIEQYQRALKLDPRNAGIRFNLAVALYKAARIESAAEALTQLLADDAKQTNARVLLADCYLQMGEHKKIVELLTATAEQAPDNLAMAYVLGTALIRDGQVEKGQLYIEKIMRRGDSAEARLLLGTTYVMIGDTAKALPELQQAAKLNPNLPSVNVWLGKALTAAGNTDEARTAFRRELTINPNDFDANLQLGIILKQDQNIDEALKHFQRAAQLRPGEPNARFYVASVEVAQNKLSVALPALETLVKDAPDFVEAHVMLA